MAKTRRQISILGIAHVEFCEWTPDQETQAVQDLTRKSIWFGTGEDYGRRIGMEDAVFTFVADEFFGRSYSG